MRRRIDSHGASHVPEQLEVVGPFGLLLLSAAPRIDAQQIDTAAALSALREAARACENDGGATWGKSLCGPIALVERQSRLVIANDSGFGQPFVRLGDAYLTTAPNGTGFANTMFDWAGRTWAMILLPLSTDAFARVTLLMHEVFHREQKALGLAGQDPPNNHLDEREGRRWLRLELQAYAMALDAVAAKDERSRAHTAAALLFRARRHQLYPQADTLEAALEMQEGLAEYTGERLAMAFTGASTARVARHVREYQATPTYVRSFAYATGPAIGVLLDHFAPSWQRNVAGTRDPARLLARAIGRTLPNDLAREAERLVPLYDGARITAEEATRDSVRGVAIARYRTALIEGPTLTLTQKSLGRTFDPQTLVGFDAENTVYPTGIFNSVWGSLEVTSGGALLANDQSMLRVAAPRIVAADKSIVSGDGWTLTLRPGWSVQPSPTRPGSYVVRPAAP